MTHHIRGDRVELTADVSALGQTHRTGDRGEVLESHTDGYLTVRFADGRTNFPHADEVKPQ